VTAFATALDAMFRDPNGTVAAVYTPHVGAPVTVRAAVERPLQIGDGTVAPGYQLSPAAQAAALTAYVRVSEVAAPTPKGDTFAPASGPYAGKTYPVLSAELDETGLQWTLTLGKGA
jgi:hypothetical protein